VSRLHGPPGLNVIARSLSITHRLPFSDTSEVLLVDQASNNVRETAAFARRVVCRTLTVVGGVAAGTALAWWLSAAAASADVESATAVPGAAVAEFAAPVTGPVETALTSVTDYLQNPPPPPEHPLKDLGDKVKDAAEQVRDQAERGFGDLPDCAQAMSDCDLGLADELPTHHQYPADGYGRADLPTTAPAPVAAAVGAVPGVDLDAIAHRTAKDRAFADGMSRRGSPEPVAPSLPDLPTWPTPFGPALPSVPATGGHGQAGNSMDSHLFAALPWQDSTFDLVAGGTSPATEVRTFGRPGAQPGVAPD